MRRLGALVALLLALTALPAEAGSPRLVVLGRDQAGDGPPALDVTYLSVGADTKVLEIRIGIAGMLPRSGGYPLLPGIEWIFEVGGRTFIAEAVATTGAPDFYLFELKGQDFYQLDNPEGTYDSADDYASILVPLEDIDASSGMRISGVGKAGTEDVDAHVHFGPYTHYPDRMATKKDYVIP